MLLILLSWLYLFFTLAVWGVGISNFLKLKNQQPIIRVVIGIFGITFFASGCAFFFRLNYEFHIILLLLNIIGFFSFRNKFIILLREMLNSIRNLSTFLKASLTIIFLLVLAQASTAPFVLDNESYYIQSIKWLNEYGFVKGLANLHLFFGQTSGWHIAQAAFNFNFLYANFNDLSAFCLLLGNYFAITELNQFFQNKKYLLGLAAGLFLVGNLLFFQFASAPSPDLAIIVLCFILFFYVLKHAKSYTSENIVVTTILCLFILFIKPTAIAIAFIPPLLIFVNWKIFHGSFPKVVMLLLIVGGIFVFKNYVLTGYFLFPTNYMKISSPDWQLPSELRAFYYEQTKAYAFLVPLEELKQMNMAEKFFHWLQMPKLHWFFNILSLLVLIIAPFFFSKFKNGRFLWFLYFLAWLQLIILFFTSPQYRFFLPFLVFLGSLIIAGIFQNEKIIKGLIGIGIFAAAIPLFIPIGVEKLSQNPITESSSSFSMNQLILPHSNSRYDLNFQNEKEGNLEYFSPQQINFFWGTGEAELPAVNKEQILYFKAYYNVVPQLRGKGLGDGFYSEKIYKN